MKTGTHGAIVISLGLAACAAPTEQQPGYDTSAQRQQTASRQAPATGQSVLLERAFKPQMLKSAGRCPTSSATCQNPVTTKPKGDGCGAEVQWDPLLVNKAGTHVQWVITNTRYEFDPHNGIVILPGGSIAGAHRVDAYTWEAVASNKPHVQAVDNYTLHVIDTQNGNQACAGDPILVSDW